MKDQEMQIDLRQWIGERWKDFLLIHLFIEKKY